MVDEELLALLRRLVDATERQATYSEEIRDSYARAEQQRASDRETALKRVADEDSRSDRTQAHIEEVLKTQKEQVAKYDAILKQYREHVERCEAWHRNQEVVN